MFFEEDGGGAQSESARQTNMTVLHSTGDIDVLCNTDSEIENASVKRYIINYGNEKFSHLSRSEPLWLGQG